MKCFNIHIHIKTKPCSILEVLSHRSLTNSNFSTWVTPTNQSPVSSRPNRFELHHFCAVSCQDASKKIGLKEADKIRSKKTKKRKSEGRVVQTLHIQAFEACPTEQHDLLKSDEHHELVGQRHVQPDRRGGGQDHEEEREGNLGLERGEHCCEASPAWRVGHPCVR